MKYFREFIDTDNLNEDDAVNQNNFVSHVENIFGNYYKVKNLSKRMKIENYHSSNYGIIIFDRGPLIGDPFDNSEYIVTERRIKFVVDIKTETEKLKITSENIDNIIHNYKDMKKELVELEKLLNKNIKMY